MKELSVLLFVASVTFAGMATAAPPLRDDVVKDGIAEIMFRGGSSLAYWNMYSVVDGQLSPTTTSHYAGDGGPGYTVVAVSDFDGDGSADVLWTNGAHLKMWINDGFGSYTPVSVGNYGGGWQPFAAGDINGDGKSDLFFRGATHLAYWLMDGPSVTHSSYAGDGGAGYRVVAINEFTGPINNVVSVDVLWTNGSQLKLWTSFGATGVFYPFILSSSYSGGWEPFAAGDVDGDGTTDILFRGGSHIAYWLVRYDEDFFPFWSFESRYAGDGGAGFRPVAVSNYNNDPHSADILWTNGSQIKIWVNGCSPWDYGDCSPDEYHPRVIGTYGGGWEPLEMLISAN